MRKAKAPRKDIPPTGDRRTSQDPRPDSPYPRWKSLGLHLQSDRTRRGERELIQTP